MTERELDEIRAQAAQAAGELMDAAGMEPGQVLVVLYDSNSRHK